LPSNPENIDAVFVAVAYIFEQCQLQLSGGAIAANTYPSSTQLIVRSIFREWEGKIG
jgi:hypothetical protein